jgi:hypothetical protein
MNNDECGMMNAQWNTRSVGRRSDIHPSSFITHHFRRSGISLMEVLISIFILSVGLLGVASLIPLGKIALRETEKSDRTGACGRAALREVKVRKMLDYTNWWAPPSPGAAVAATDTPGVIALDPLGYTISTRLGNDTNAAGVPRYTFWENAAAPQAMSFANAEPIFFWQDEVLFNMPKERTTVPANAGDRPMVITNTGLVTGIPLRDGNFTWFLTVTPSPADVAASISVSQRRSYAVSIVVCNGRKLGTDGERTIPNVYCDSPIGYGGISVYVAGDKIAPAGQPPLKNDEWVLLYTTGVDAAGTTRQYSWYRVVHAGYDGTTNTRINLVGPDWHGDGDSTGAGGAANMVVVGGVTGVYTTTVELDTNNLIWTK